MVCFLLLGFEILKFVDIFSPTPANWRGDPKHRARWVYVVQQKRFFFFVLNCVWFLIFFFLGSPLALL